MIMETVLINILDAVLAITVLAFVVWFCCWIICTISNAVTLYRQHAAWDAEYWPRRFAQIEAEEFHRNIPARLDKWNAERNGQ